MDGIHDLGGREGFGPVAVEHDEPVFHFDWERRAFGLTFGTFLAALSNGGQFRHAIERMDPVHYLTSRYYEHWITGVATRAVEAGLVTAQELAARAGGAVPLSRPVMVDRPPPLATVGGESPIAVGTTVRVRHVSTRGHTRCPAYVRGRTGTVARVDPVASLPDVEAHTEDRRLQPVYSVRFDARELWGEEAGGRAAGAPTAVYVDLWHDYLERA